MLRLQNLAAGVLRSGGSPFRERLDEVVSIVKEAMLADSATLLLYDASARELSSVASVGIAAKEDYVASLDIRSFVGQIAASEEPVSLDDVRTTRLEIPEALRRSGIRSLLGMRLPERETLTGVVYVGIREERPFNGREAARLELLCEHLTLHLDNAALVQRLQANITALEQERALRERFVSVLAHDLRGPLSTAKMITQLLINAATRTESRDHGQLDLLGRIERNLDRTDRMVRDLLDASRIHAGEDLPLVLADCDLVKIAREVVDELTTVHGPRFRLAGDPVVRGLWDADQIHRSLWNLGVNAVKYGAPLEPITVSMFGRDDFAEIRVHNVGPSIAREDQETLFRPFVRSSSAHASRARGWGLGLTLVRAAAEAHGGSVYVESDEDCGTTFIVKLPYERPRRATPQRDDDPPGATLR